jgi:CO/xanthine dehydrogenase FAD-binding subunit
MAAAAVFFDVDDAGKACNAHIAAIGVGDRPRRLGEAEAEVNGRVVDVAISERAGRAASAGVNPQSDIHASGAYRKSLIGTMVERALQSAAGVKVA